MGGESGTVLRLFVCFAVLHKCLSVSHNSLDSIEQAERSNSNYMIPHAATSEEKILETHLHHNHVSQEENKFYELLRRRRQVDSAENLKQLVEETVKDVASKVEREYPIALYGSKCSSLDTVYDGCLGNTPDITTDTRYSVPVSMTTSNVHFSEEGGKVFYGEVHDEQLNKTLQNSLCVSGDNLDVLWSSNVQLDGYTVKWQEFIDSTSGYTRTFPGVNENENNCKEPYDPRLKSWYVSMVSPPKDVAIVLDVTMETNIELMKKAASAVLNTLTKNDNAAIYMSYKINEASQQPSLTKATSSQRHTWLTETSNIQLTPSDDDLGKTVSKAMNDINSHLRSTGTSGSCVRVMVLLTDRVVPISVLHDVANSNSDRMDIRVFTYTIGQNANDPVSKQISCDNKGAWFMVQNTSDIHLISRYYQLLSPAEHLQDVMWSELHPFRYESSTGISGCLPATNISNTILDYIGVACVFLENSTFSDFDDGDQVLSELSMSTTRGCPLTLFSDDDLWEMRPEDSQCDRPISRTAKELRDFAEKAVKTAARRAEINYQIASTFGDCIYSEDIYDMCRLQPTNLNFDEEFGRKVAMETSTLHMTVEMENMLSQNATLEDFQSRKDLYTSVCTSGSLDQHWRTFVGENRDIRWQFYGDQRDRFLRIYPGIQDSIEECSRNSSEAPFRTWFPSAASSPKDVIIIVDSNHIDQLPLMQESMTSLVNTLTRYDFANVIINGKAVYKGMVKTTNRIRQEMIHLATNLNPNNSSRDVIGSFTRAKSAWEYAMDAGNASRCVEAVLFLTDSILQDQLLEDIQNVIKRIDRFRVFSYSIGPLADQTNSWNLACQNRGIWTHFKTVYDIWAHISDYYNYFSSNEPMEDVIWSEVYQDRYGLGPILSGCLPVYNTQSAHLTLLGVVCVDIMEQTLKSFHDYKEVYDSMMGGVRQCPAIQLNEEQIEALRTGDAKCTRLIITNAKQTQQYTEDSLRRLADFALGSYQRIHTPGTESCPFGAEVSEVCQRSPPVLTIRPNVSYPQYLLGDSTVLLSREESQQLDKNMENLDLQDPLFIALCLSDSFVSSWNRYAQVAYHYFIGEKLDSTCTRVFPDVVFGKDVNYCGEPHRDERILRIQKETDIKARLSPRDFMIVIQNTEETNLNLMKKTIQKLTRDMTPMDTIGMVTTGGSHHDNKMEFFTQRNEEDFLDFIQDLRFAKETRTLTQTLQEAFYVLRENTQNCLPVMMLLTDAKLDDDLIELFEAFTETLNVTVFVYLYGDAGSLDDTKQIAMEIACANNGAWDKIYSESTVERVENYPRFLSSDMSNVKTPVWFEMTSDLLLPSIQSNPMVSCMPVVVDGSFIGSLCDVIARHTFTQYNDSSQVLHSLRNQTHQCMRDYLSKEEQSELRRNGVKCGTPRPRGLAPAGIAGLIIGIAIVIVVIFILAYVLYKHQDSVSEKMNKAFRSLKHSRRRPDSSDYIDGSFLLLSEDEDRYY